MEERVVLYRADPTNDFWTLQLERDGSVIDKKQVPGKIPEAFKAYDEWSGIPLFVPQTKYTLGLTPEEDIRRVSDAGKAAS